MTLITTIILVAHILFSCVSIVGSYMIGLSLIKSIKTGQDLDTNDKKVKRGKMLTIVGTILVTLTGFHLLFQDLNKFMSKGYFVANVSIIVIILAIEIAFLFIDTKNKKNLLINRTLSMFSWTWVFLMAFMELPYSFTVLIVAYIVCALIETYLVIKKLDPYISKK